MSEIDHTVFVFRNLNTGEVVTAYLDSALHYERSASEYQHLATINPRLWIQTHYDTIYKAAHELPTTS